MDSKKVLSIENYSSRVDILNIRDEEKENMRYVDVAKKLKTRKDETV
jgi:hypothetical protein